MPKPWIYRCAKTVGALLTTAALSGCIFVPVRGPRYGYYRPQPYGYY